MKTRSISNVFVSALLFLLFSMLVNCGGGGGDGGGAPAPPAPTPVTYTGITTQATITEANAEVLSSAALGAGQIGLAAGITTEGNVDNAQYLKLFRMLRDSTVDITLIASSQMVAGATVPMSYSESGNCGGSLYLTGTLDDQTGSCSGTLTYNSYCSNGVIGSGVCNFSGVYNLVAKKIDVLTLTSDDLKMTFTGGAATVRFTTTFDYRPFPNIATMDMMMRDEATGKVYWAKDYVVNVWDYPGMTYTDMSILAGSKSYHPDYGYVLVSTTANFRTNDSDDYPFQGVLLCEGQPGTSGGNTTAILTALSALTYNVVADTDGDAAIEWDSGTLNW